MIFNFASNKTVDFTPDSPKVMGIVNVTPDSFSGDGIYKSVDKALFSIENMIKNGADIIDIGGESTRPGAEYVSQEEELDRVIPVIEKCKSNFDTIISIDTYKAKVALESVKAGASIVNDISGFITEPSIIDSAIGNNVAYIYTFCGKPKQAPSNDNQIRQDFISQCQNEFSSAIATLQTRGVSQIILDIGLGFNKTLAENYYLLKHLNELHSFQLPHLIGLSRKSMIGKVIDKEQSRLSSTVGLNLLAIQNGASIIRVHDVPEHVQMIKCLQKYMEI